MEARLLLKVSLPVGVFTWCLYIRFYRRWYVWHVEMSGWNMLRITANSFTNFRMLPTHWSPFVVLTGLDFVGNAPSALRGFWLGFSESIRKPSWRVDLPSHELINTSDLEKRDGALWLLKGFLCS